MSEICPVCGLPKELCVCKEIEKAQEKIRIFVEKRRYGKITTVIEGLKDRPKEILSELKSKFGCGGTYKNGHLELQGDHRKKVREYLLSQGYKEEQIEVI